MADLVVLLIVVLGLVAAYGVIRLMPSNWAKAAAVLLVVVSIAIADSVWTRMQLMALCAKEGGTRIYRVVDGVDGLFSKRLADSLVSLHGYAFGETIEMGQLIRISKDQSGKILKTPVTERLSRYEHVFTEQAIDPMLFRHQDSIKDSSSGEVLGVFTDFHYYGGWIARLVDSVFHDRTLRAHCAPGLDVGAVRLIKDVLKTGR